MKFRALFFLCFFSTLLVFAVPTRAAPEHGGDHAADPAQHGAEPAHGEHGSHGPTDINWTDFGNKEQPAYATQLINFAVLLGIFYLFGKKPILEGLKSRRTAVAKEIEEAQRMKKEAEDRAKVYQAKLESLEAELATAKAALVEAGKGERDRIIKEAQEKAERMVRDAKELLVQEAKQVQQDLVRETVEIAMTAAEEILKARITSADHDRLADDYLSGLIARPSLVPPPTAPSTGGAT